MNNINISKKTNRIIYFDYLRFFSILAVIVLHVSCQNWSNINVRSLQWQTFNLFDSIVRWCVPVFVMISGALFLNKEIPLKKIYFKYILRLAIAFIVWSIIYSLFIDVSFSQRLLLIIKGHYHMWFILMIIGIYMCNPLIKPITDNNNRMKYFLLLSFIFAFVFPELTVLIKDFGNKSFIKLINAIKYNIRIMNLQLVMGYVGYFILGYYLSKNELHKKTRIIIYILELLGFVFTIGMDSWVALRTNKACSHYYDYFMVNVLFEAISIFTWFKYHNFNNDRINKIVNILAKYSFGAYLIHALILEQLYIRFGLNTLLFNPFASVICITLIVSVISFILSALINHIPKLNKYII